MLQQKTDFQNVRRFKVAPECPCGKSNRDGKFAPLKDCPTAGKCHSCGQFFAPARTRTPVIQRKQTERPPAPPRSIPPGIMQRSCNPEHYLNQQLYVWFALKIGSNTKAATRIFQTYNVGTDKKGNTVFWLVDKKGKVRQPRITRYDQNGHRWKDITGYVPPQYTGKQGFKPCLFGEHLLRQRPTAPVAFTESEKNALVGAYLYPERVWISLDGSQNYRKAIDLAPELHSRTVQVWPDCDTPGHQSAEHIYTELNKASIATSIHQPPNPNQIKGYDLADWFAENYPA